MKMLLTAIIFRRVNILIMSISVSALISDIEKPETNQCFSEEVDMKEHLVGRMSVENFLNWYVTRCLSDDRKFTSICYYYSVTSESMEKLDKESAKLKLSIFIDTLTENNSDEQRLMFACVVLLQNRLKGKKVSVTDNTVNATRFMGSTALKVPKYSLEDIRYSKDKIPVSIFHLFNGNMMNGPKFQSGYFFHNSKTFRKQSRDLLEYTDTRNLQFLIFYVKDSSEELELVSEKYYEERIVDFGKEKFGKKLGKGKFLFLVFVFFNTPL